MRGVGDELAAGAVEPREPQAHPLERAGELTQLVRTVVDDRLVEAAGRDAVRGVLEPPDPPREEACARVAEQNGEHHRERAGLEHAAANHRDDLQLIVQRRLEHQHRAADRVRHLGVRLVAAGDEPARQRALADCVERNRVVLELRGIGLEVGVGDRLEQRRLDVLQVVDDDARVHLGLGSRRELLLQVRLGREARDHRAQRRLEAAQLVVRERGAIRRDDDQVDDRQHARNHREKGEREPAADAPERGHRSRKR